MIEFQPKGFALLGLLITIVIIAILAGIMMKFYFGNKTPTQEVHQGIEAIDAAHNAQNIVDQKNRQLEDEVNKN